MIAISAVLVIVATVTLVVGIFQSGLTFIGISIASSVAAFAALVLGVVRGRKEPETATAGSQTEQFAAARSHEVIPAEANPVVPLLLEDEESDEDDAGEADGEAAEEEEEADEELQPLRFDAGPTRPARPRPSTSRPSTSRAKPAASRAKPAKATKSAKTAAKKTTATRAKSAAKKTTAKPAKTTKSAAKPAARKPAARKPAARKPSTRSARPSDQ